ncbi:TonB-dependent receptor [Undibacterium cyanobacteriorum]|uniref:TonB-dependent receptor n=1 Tax=Undibacterium cyanobacteriorum TaxID=3073561 RepID=A0ABY9RLV9_9BURK|nr:TonB-dependent receptor [Undibacterium sp. 20NA77.5]WMW80981.1 TonB-dependent receptor [Undibacterium sp. 20NA77.5]
MSIQRKIIASAILSIFSPFTASVWAQTSTVTVSANPLGKEESMQILSPTKILSGNELRSKIGSSLGETLGAELGVSASGFGAGASRPIIRGLEGPRVKILQNGMAVADVSSVSNDHAVASETASSQQIEILRGPAALLYGSGAIGGLVNVVDGRIPTTLSKQLSGEAEIKYGAVNQEKSASFFLDRSIDNIALHLDGNARDAGNYKIPGAANVDGSGEIRGTLPSSFSQEKSLGIGASLIQGWGHFGASLQRMEDKYGIPTDEHSFIDLRQTRFDIDGAVFQSFLVFDSLKLKLGATDYAHTEKMEDGTPATEFKNKTVETRLTASHTNWSGWEGSLGLHTENSSFSALAADTGRADTVPSTRSTSIAAFLLEQKKYQDFTASFGGRLENVERKPEAQFGEPARSFSLSSFSAGAMIPLSKDLEIVTSLSTAERAPSTEELYSRGPHESTLTFDIGNSQMRKETSRNLEFSLQKSSGLWHWKINTFVNRVRDYVYGQVDGVRVNEEGDVDPDGEFMQRHWKQANATIRGGEAEISYNQLGDGFSLRGFADTSRGTLERKGNLPLQAADRFGLDIGYRQNAWRGTLSILHAQKQDRLANSESFVTPAFTKVDLNVTYTHPYQYAQLTWFMQVRNLFDQDIRLATSILKETVPQPRRGLVLGLRANF